MSLTPDEISAITFLSTALNTINEVAELRSRNVELLTDAIDRANYINLLEETDRTNTETIEALRAQLATAQAEIVILNETLAQTRAALEAEQKLAGEHWSNLQAVTAERDGLADSLLATRTVLTTTETNLSEAETKLARFRDILGLPAVVPVVNEPALAPAAPVMEVVSEPPMSLPTVPTSFPVSTAPVDIPVITRDPHITSAVNAWYNDDNFGF